VHTHLAHILVKFVHRGVQILLGVGSGLVDLSLSIFPILVEFGVYLVHGILCVAAEFVGLGLDVGASHFGIFLCFLSCTGEVGLDLGSIIVSLL
jgi:hypothetical protein